MSLLGKAAVLIWNDVIENEREAFYEWHDKEHIPERLSVPGFMRGRRYRGDRSHGATEWLTMYEADHLDTLTSPAYLARLNDPTPLTRRTVKAFRNTARSICRVLRTSGQSTGGHVLTLPIAEDFETQALACLLEKTSVLAAHVFVADETASNIDTKEAREREFVVPKNVLFVETSTIAAAWRVFDDLRSGSAVESAAAEGGQSGVFSLEISRLPA
ncbi:hypothetical protein EOS_15865 [Caballeronia mineralivorans PML1(12)]|uniref:Uncharacterized protein n=1 Tax=Caballeronia mineralivorans PML1(12) TaxID=908627 RepID=A0A0J1CY16_9BURK|nr:DUF4286 family protein [Caballeronia mineralivorans]KLU25241.1 hypothetical protein EOS_15865 [Caballeronia mineralivorans PML1(12)]